MTYTVRAQALLDALHSRPVVGDGAMGTMLQKLERPDSDGCNELLNVTQPDAVGAVHDAYLAVGVDTITTNTFGANAVVLSEYQLADRVAELAQAGAQIARDRAEIAAQASGQPRWVLGSLGPGSKLPSLGQITYRELRDTYAEASRGLLRGGVDAILVETVQDPLQAKAAVNGSRQAMREVGLAVPVLVSVTIEESGTMLLGTDIAAALTLLQGLGVDAIGLNCATGPDLMTEHVRFLAAHSPVPITVMPNAGLPEIGLNGAFYPLTPEALAAAQADFIDEFGVSLVGGCCGTTPEHLRAVVDAVRDRRLPRRSIEPRNDVSSLYSATALATDLLTVGERTNANGSRAFRDLLLAEDWDGVVALAKDQAASGAELLDLCIDYVGRSGADDMAAAVGRLKTAASIPLMIDSTEPTVLAAGLELLGSRPVVNSVNYEDGDGPDSRFARTMALVVEHGTAVVGLTIDEDGQARTAAQKVAIATRLIESLTTEWGMAVADIIIDPLTFPIATGQDETRRDAIETLTAISEIKRRFPGVHIMLGLSNVSFGLLPRARRVLNSVFLAEAQAAGVDVAILSPGKILPRSDIAPEAWQAAEDLVWDRREYDANGEVTYDPLTRLLGLFPAKPAARVVKPVETTRPDAPDLASRIAARVIDGDRSGLAEDLGQALADGLKPLEILNDVLLPAMAVVGERFGAGQTQLPFVLQSAEVMKAAVNWLEPHLAKDDNSGSRGTIVLATVRGDVHDIGKNLVDIILSNNGYQVVNIGIKVPIDEIIAAALANDADVIGMSGLLVKSTQIMQENLAVLAERGFAERWPVVLGGAALNRRFVEEDLAAEFPGTVRYAKDAFAGLALMPELVALAKIQARAVTRLPGGGFIRHPADNPGRPVPPFWGTRVVTDIPLARFLPHLDKKTLFTLGWGLTGPTAADLARAVGEPRLQHWLDKIRSEPIIDPKLVYGYFRATHPKETGISTGYNKTVILRPASAGAQNPPSNNATVTFDFPRQTREPYRCLADWVGDVLPLQLVTVGQEADDYAAELFAADKYRDYFEFNALAAALAEALADYWHGEIRAELNLPPKQGERFSFGYPACPELSDRKKLVELLSPERIGVELSEEFQLHPEHSTDALIATDPKATYFRAV